jgi:hypothetical protein
MLSWNTCCGAAHLLQSNVGMYVQHPDCCMTCRAQHDESATATHVDKIQAPSEGTIIITGQRKINGQASPSRYSAAKACCSCTRPMTKLPLHPASCTVTKDFETPPHDLKPPTMRPFRLSGFEADSLYSAGCGVCCLYGHSTHTCQNSLCARCSIMQPGRGTGSWNTKFH